MTRARLGVFLAIPVITLSVIAACTGDDPSFTTPAPDGGTSLVDAPAANDVVVGDSGTPSCPVDTAECDDDPANGCETNIKTSPANCGKCANACGGKGTCTGGVCDAEKLVDGVNHPFGLENAGARLMWFVGDGNSVDGCRSDDCSASATALADIYPNNSGNANVDWSPRQMVAIGADFYVANCPGGADCLLSKCPVTGCKLDGLAAVSPNNYNLQKPFEMVAGGGAIYWWQSQDRISRHDLGDGGVTFYGDKWKIVDYLKGLYVDGTRVIYVDDNPSGANPTGGIFTCPAPGCTGARTPIVGPAVKLLAVGGGRAITTTGGANAANASIISCDYVNGCGNAGDVLATGQAYVRDLVADDQAVYWVTSGNADVKTGQASTGTVMRCALPKCAGGPTKIADAQLNLVSVRLDADYVYWASFGTAAQKNGSIWRRKR